MAGACTSLGALLANGQGVTKDEAKAFILYQKACSGGDTNGCFSVALAYYTGKGVAMTCCRRRAFIARVATRGMN